MNNATARPSQGGGTITIILKIAEREIKRVVIPGLFDGAEAQY